VKIVSTGRLAALSLLLWGSLAGAQPGLEAGIALRHSELDLLSAGNIIPTDVTRAGVALWESPRPWLRLGLEGGVLRLSQQDNPATQGMELTGQYAALSGSGHLSVSDTLDLSLRLSYGYQRAEGAPNLQQTRLSWHDGQAELAATLKLFPLYLSGGGFAYFIDGDETASGSLTYTREFEAAENSGAFLALDYWVDAGGRVSVRGELGGREGIEIQFARRF
jgi:hypothetical protein